MEKYKLSYMIAAACLSMDLDYFSLLSCSDGHYLVIENGLVPRLIFTYSIYTDLKDLVLLNV